MKSILTLSAAASLAIVSFATPAWAKGPNASSCAHGICKTIPPRPTPPPLPSLPDQSKAPEHRPFPPPDVAAVPELDPSTLPSALVLLLGGALLLTERRRAGVSDGRSAQA